MITNSRTQNFGGGGYFSEITIAKGIAVLCVLLGHAFPDAQTGMTDPIAAFVLKLMYSFHMGCFFLLSGFVSGKKLCKDKVDLKHEVIKKLKRLMVPYFFYSLITIGLKQVFSSFANNQFDLSEIWKILIGKNPNGGMWYLWTLFIISVIFLVVSQFVRNPYCYFVIALCMYGLYWIFPSSFINNVLEYTIFYAIGILLQQKYDFIKPVLHSKKGVLIAFGSGVVFVLLTAFMKCPYLITAVIGSLSVLAISCWISDRPHSKDYKILNELGNYSYDIYLISYFVQVPIRVIFYRILPLPYWMVVFMMFVLGAVIPYVVCKYVIRKIPITDKLLLGNWK